MVTLLTWQQVHDVVEQVVQLEVGQDIVVEGRFNQRMDTICRASNKEDNEEPVISTVWVKVFVCDVFKNPGWIGPGWKHPKENRRTDGSSLSSLVEYFLTFVYLFFNPNASNAVFAVFQPFLLVCESVFCIQGFGSVRSVRGCGCT